MKKRKVVTRSGARMRGYFNSQKDEMMIPWESGLEKKASLLFTYSPGVKKFTSFQEEISYYDGPIQRVCYLDFQVELYSGEILLIEVKDQRKLIDPEVRKKYSLISDRVKQLGKHFRLLTDEHINQQPRLTNLREIAYHRPRKICDQPTIKREQLETVHCKTFKEVATELGGERIVWQMLSMLRLRCDLSQPISSTTIVEFAEDDHDSLLF